MGREILRARAADGRETRYLLEVFAEGERWTSTLTPLDAAGRPTAEVAAPRFYGLTAEQARRRMITVLEQDYDEVEPAGDPSA